LYHKSTYKSIYQTVRVDNVKGEGSPSRLEGYTSDYMQQRLANTFLGAFVVELARLRPVAANAVVIAIALAAYRALPLSLIGAPSVLWSILFFASILYLLGHSQVALIRGPRTSKGELVLSLCRKILKEEWSATTADERLALRVVAVKFFFIPLMLSFIITNGTDLYMLLTSLPARAGTEGLISMLAFNTTWYPLLFNALLLTDVSFFMFGYLVDHAVFGNVIRSVDSTFLGWTSALICYPPINSATNAVLGWYASDSNGPFRIEWEIFAFNLLALALFCIYVWATVALGTRCSNLTNRGIVDRGPYAYVRHPAYAAKNAVWLISVVPLLSIVAYASALSWAGIYYLRAITEERHLSQDPEYLAYKAKVKWRFVPYIW
jgi:hypothetical protein